MEPVKTIRCRATIPPMPGHWEINATPLPVLAQDGVRVGFAVTRLTADGIDVEMFLAGDTPECFDLELGRKLYIAPKDFELSKEFGSPVFVLRNLLLTTSPNAHFALVEPTPWI